MMKFKPMTTEHVLFHGNTALSIISKLSSCRSWTPIGKHDVSVVFAQMVCCQHKFIATQQFSECIADARVT